MRLAGGLSQCRHNQQSNFGLASDRFPIQIAAERPTPRTLPRGSGDLYALPIPVCRRLGQDLL